MGKKNLDKEFWRVDTDSNSIIFFTGLKLVEKRTDCQSGW
jgi:hypothetical protein